MEKVDDICGLKKAACAAYYNNEFIKQKTLCLGAKVLMFWVQLSLSIIISMSSSEKCQNINFMAMDINTITIVITMEGTDNKNWKSGPHTVHANNFHQCYKKW